MKQKQIPILLIILMFVSNLMAQVNIGDRLPEIDYSIPKEYEIGGITVSGIKYLDNNMIIVLSGLSVGMKVKIPGEEIADAIDKLWKQGLFENIVVTATKIQGEFIFLDINLLDKPRLSKFSFSGVKSLSPINNTIPFLEFGLNSPIAHTIPNIE